MLCLRSGEHHADVTESITNCVYVQENVTLTSLNLSMNGIAVSGVRHVCNLLLVNRTITDVDLTCTRIVNDGAFLLGKMLESNETLKTLRVNI